MPLPFRFETTHQDPGSRARRGLLHTLHGTVETPVFMPVGTHGAVRALSPDEILATGTRMILSNTYHLYLRPGASTIASMGGLHRFMGWSGPILTDSGGFQVFSLAERRRITDEGVEFRSHLDGSSHMLTPETAIAIQRALGSDVAMILDECSPATATRDEHIQAMRRTSAWSRRCLDVFGAGSATGSALFGIIQGGTHADLRREHASEIVGMGFDGHAVGGVSVGESREEIWGVGELTGPLLPVEKPRYMMGLGAPSDLVRLIGYGFDMFDCVMPTRNARNGTLFTRHGMLHIKNEAHTRDPRPIDEECACYACRRFSRGYLRHLFLSGEILGHRLNSIHNVHFYQDLMRGAREAIASGSYAAWRDATLEGLAQGVSKEAEA